MLPIIRAPASSPSTIRRHVRTQTYRPTLTAVRNVLTAFVNVRLPLHHNPMLNTYEYIQCDTIALFYVLKTLKEAQLSQRVSGMLRVIEYVVKSLNVSQG